MAAFPECVAIVDDELMILEAFAMLFEAMDVRVAFLALDGPTALQRIATAKPSPDVIIIDFRMPKMNGLELMREVRKIQPGIRIVFTSADEDIRQVALDAGADAFLTKPVKIETIMECIGARSS
jgi:CheY-like chemotaxis protein